MLKSLLVVLFMLTGLSVHAETLPGFRVERIAPLQGFVTSLVFDSSDRLYYTATDGRIFRLETSGSVLVATVPTASEGNAVLLGMALLSDTSAVVHYVAPDLTADLIGIVNLVDGTLQQIASFLCDNGRPCSSEHHGGNPIVNPEGFIYVTLGDFGAQTTAQDPNSPGGKLFRISTSGVVTRIAIGLRNAFDLAWEPVSRRLVVTDNGAVGNDEIHVVSPGENLGWPLTSGNEPQFPGTSPPSWVFSGTVAPTGVFLANGAGGFGKETVFTAGFVPKTIYWFPNRASEVFVEPLELIKGETAPIIDLAQNSKGEVVFGTPGGLYRIILPIKGDANGDGKVDDADFDAISREILDGDGDLTIHAHLGSFRGSWGADVNDDGFIDASDLVALANLNRRPSRTRAPRVR